MIHAYFFVTDPESCKIDEVNLLIYKFIIGSWTKVFRYDVQNQ